MRWEAAVWASWLALFFVFEAIGLWRRRKDPGAMTLTYFIESHFQRWMLACLLGWLVYHFLIAPNATG